MVTPPPDNAPDVLVVIGVDPVPHVVYTCVVCSSALHLRTETFVHFSHLVTANMPENSNRMQHHVRVGLASTLLSMSMLRS